MWGKKEPKKSKPLSREELLTETEKLKQEVLRQEIKKQERASRDGWYATIGIIAFVVAMLSVSLYATMPL